MFHNCKLFHCLHFFLIDQFMFVFYALSSKFVSIVKYFHIFVSIVNYFHSYAIDSFNFKRDIIFVRRVYNKHFTPHKYVESH